MDAGIKPAYHSGQRHAEAAKVMTRQRKRGLRVYCQSDKCRGHILTPDELEAERAAARAYLYQPPRATSQPPQEPQR